MPKILDNGTFRVYIYANDDNPHHLPHCHVYGDGDDHASVVSLPDLVVIVGAALPRAARRYLRANVDVLVAAWRRLPSAMRSAARPRAGNRTRSTSTSGAGWRASRSR